jgi:hypothetical protein
MDTTAYRGRDAVVRDRALKRMGEPDPVAEDRQAVESRDVIRPGSQPSGDVPDLPGGRGGLGGRDGAQQPPSPVQLPEPAGEQLTERVSRRQRIGKDVGAG